MSIVALTKPRIATAKPRKISGKPLRRALQPDPLSAFDGRANDLPADLAQQHDHYLYGTSKRNGEALSPIPGLAAAEDE